MDKHITEVMPMYLFFIIKNISGAANENIIKSNTNQKGVLQPQKKIPFSMLIEVKGYGILFSENFAINEQELKISQSIQTVFQIKYGITSVNKRDLIFLKYFLLL